MAAKCIAPRSRLIAFPAASAYGRLSFVPRPTECRGFFLNRNTDDHGRFQRSRTGSYGAAGKLGNPRPLAAAKPGCRARRSGQLALGPAALRRGRFVAAQGEDFYADAHQRLYRHLFALHDEGKRVDITLLVERLKQAGEYEAIGGGSYLAEVAQSVPYAHNAPHYAQIVRDKATVRELIHAATEILRDAWDPGREPRHLVGDAEEKIFSVYDRRSNDRITHIQDLLIEAFDRIDARLAKGQGDAVATHFADLDNLTGGLHPSEFIVLAARPSMGKTALATNIAENVAILSRVPVLFVSLEMSRLELAQRLLCSQGSIDGSKFRSGFISAAEREKLMEAAGKLSQSPLSSMTRPAAP